ncbi:hypothetical protein AALP_AAs67539U000200 [Arabis alpina]|uniref:Uncharacterized protein n=1 Tax=Arabis alpina TaxID=50452 RepID=A0A087G0S0_ARAAL|nr:hypothetical protein AALP_AAs67539U000200 [Arabis alpina]
MERPRSFRSLARRTFGSGKPPAPTTATTSAAPTTVPAPTVPTTAPPSVTPTTAPASSKATTVPASTKSTTAPASARLTTAPPSEPRDTSSAGKTTTAAKGSRLPSSTRTELVAALPALHAPLPSDYDAKKAAKGKGHAGDDRKRSSDRDDMTDVDREPKRARARSASPPRRVSSSSLFSTLVFHDDAVAPIDTKSSGDVMRQGLKFLALVNKVGHKLEAEVEDLKRNLEDETHRSENARTTAEVFLVERTAPWASIDKKNNKLTDQAREIDLLKAEARKSAKALLIEAERSAMALAAAEEREQCSAAILMKRDGELATVMENLRKEDGHIQSLERKFTRARDKFDELQGDLRGNMVYQVQRVANLDFARLLLGLLDGQEPPKLEDELTFLTADVAKHAGDEERFERLMKSLHGLLHVLDPKVKAPTVVAHDRTLETYAASVGLADPLGSLLGGTGPCKAAVVGVDGKFSLIGGVGAEVTKSRIDDVTEDAETVEAPEEMRTDEDSQGSRIDAITEDPRLDDIFGETEAEGVPVTQVAPPGVDEEVVL